jgi:BrnA antitoxin of type II toxin-antitoxin system
MGRGLAVSYSSILLAGRTAVLRAHKRPIDSTRRIAFDTGSDFSDAPAVVDWSGTEMDKFYRPTKKPVTMRLDSDVIKWLKADGHGSRPKRIASATNSESSH